MASQAVSLAAARPARGAWLVLAILCFVYVLNFLDRPLLSILAKPLQDAPGVTHCQPRLIGAPSVVLSSCSPAIPPC